jgi:ribosome-associated protein
MLYITPKISIDEREIREEFVHSSGPGGQNVNKVATAVKLRFDVLHSPSLPDEVRQRLIQLAGKRMNRKGELIIDARRFRTQETNRKDAVDRLILLVRKATQKPKPRFKTKPTRSSRERRMEVKHRRSEVKQGRKKAATSRERRAESED